MHWFQQLEQELVDAKLSLDQFREVVSRLLENGILCRQDSKAEERLYDLLCRMETQVEDYLRILGIRVYRDSQFEFVRVYPRGSRIPGVSDDSEDETSMLRSRVSADEAAALLVLRMLYEQALLEGRVNDEGEVPISADALQIAMHARLSRALPAGLTERRTLFSKLRYRFRVLHFDPEADLTRDDVWLYIRPTLLSLVSPDALESLSSGPVVAPDSTEEEKMEGCSDVD